MQIGSLLNIGLQGYQQATNQANQAAQNIASQSVTNAAEADLDTADLTESLVDLKTAEISAKANVRVIETASDLIGSLLDVKA